MCETAGVNDRRKYIRAALQWDLLLTRKGELEAVQAITRNLSTAGFYCLSEESFGAGERLECRISIPHGIRPYSDPAACLHCDVRVVRVERLENESSFGIACRIEDYTVVHSSRAASVSASAA